MQTFIATYAGEYMPLLIRAADMIDAVRQAERLHIAPLLSIRSSTFADDHYNMDLETLS